MSTNFRISNPNAPSSGSSPATSALSSRSASPANGRAVRAPHAPNRPSGLSRTGGFVAHAEDSSDEDGSGHSTVRRPQARGSRQKELAEDDEEVVGWDANGALLNQAKTAPLIIAPLANRDWRNSSRSTAQRSVFLPESARAALSGEEVVTREVVDTSLHTGGLRIMSRKRLSESSAIGEDGKIVDDRKAAEPELTLEQRALRALMAGEDEEDAGDVGAIPVQENNRAAPISEEEAFRRDVETRPEESSLDDYARVPVASFGLALLKGMGWKEGQAASRTRTGMVTPYEPKARPALLGIGAKEREQPELKKGEKPKGEWKKRQEAKVYVPVMKSTRESSVAGPSSTTRTPASSVPSSGRPSRSRSPPSRPPSSSSRRRSRSRERDPERGNSSSSSSRRREDDRYTSSSSRWDDDSYGSSSTRRNEREKSSSARRDADRGGSSRRDDRNRDYEPSRRYDADERDSDYRRDREVDDHRRRSDRDRDDRRR